LELKYYRNANYIWQKSTAALKSTNWHAVYHFLRRKYFPSGIAQRGGQPTGLVSGKSSPQSKKGQGQLVLPLLFEKLIL
jgi:hypothetical protein